MALPAPPVLFIPAETLRVLLANKYLSGSALACCVYDIAVVFDDEVRLIWSGHASFATMLVYLVNRYGVPACLGYVVHVMNGLPDHMNHDKACHSFFQLLCFVTLLNHLASNGYLVYHHYMLWERRRRVMVALVILVLFTFVPQTVLGIKAAMDYPSVTEFHPLLKTCLALDLPVALKYYWGFAIAFDFFAIVIAALNSFDRPYHHSSDIVSSLLRDGAMWFVSLSCLRLVNAVLWLKLNPLEVYIISFNLWAMTSITLSRFILRVESLRQPQKGVRIWNAESEAFELGRWSAHGY